MFLCGILETAPSPIRSAGCCGGAEQGLWIPWKSLGFDIFWDLTNTHNTPPYVSRGGTRGYFFVQASNRHGVTSLQTKTAYRHAVFHVFRETIVKINVQSQSLGFDIAFLFSAPNTVNSSVNVFSF